MNRSRISELYIPDHIIFYHILRGRHCFINSKRILSKSGYEILTSFHSDIEYLGSLSVLLKKKDVVQKVLLKSYKNFPNTVFLQKYDRNTYVLNMINIINRTNMGQHKHALEVDTGVLAPGSKSMTTCGVKGINLLGSNCGRLFILCADHLPEGLQSSSSA